MKGLRSRLERLHRPAANPDSVPASSPPLTRSVLPPHLKRQLESLRDRAMEAERRSEVASGVPMPAVRWEEGEGYRIGQAEFPLLAQAGVGGGCSATLLRTLGVPELPEVSLESLLFLDLETTGLSRGAGCLAPVVGMARVRRNALHLLLLVLGDPGSEGSLLGRVEEEMGNAGCLVTYNGKAFDLDLLRVRFRMNGKATGALDRIAHLDLLHPTRRLYRKQLGSASLGLVEKEVLGVVRGRDVSGEEIPGIFRAFYADGQFAPVERVVRHNAIDLYSLASLLLHLRGLVEGGELEGAPIGVQFELARLLIDRGALSPGLDHLERLASSNATLYAYAALLRLGCHYKRRGSHQKALGYWRAARGHCGAEDPFPWVEEAKVLEHRLRDFEAAGSLVRELVEQLPDSDKEMPALLHRLARLERRAQRLHAAHTGAAD